MKALLAVAVLVTCAAIIIVMPLVIPAEFLAMYGTFTASDAATALLFAGVLAGVFVPVLLGVKDDGGFLVNIFVGGLLVRLLIGAIIFGTNSQSFFGGDAYTYDSMGIALLNSWHGSVVDGARVLQYTGTGYSSSGWGMLYLVAGLYTTIGRNMFAVQMVNAVLGALTAPLVFLTAMRLFNHRKVARLACMAVAFFPSMVLWSAQGLKDGPIMFLLALSIFATLKLGEKFSLMFFVILTFSLFGLLTLRFYVFYIAAAAIGLAFVVGTRAMSAQSIVRQVAIVVGLGIAFSYLGVSKLANAQIAQYGNLTKVENSRNDMAGAASGFGRDVDVSTTEGVVTALPVGMTYLLFAPFPWQMASVRSLITFPEMVVWWSSFPFLVLGIWYALRFRLRQCAPILVFLSMLTVAYSVFQGNVGTAYRQRSQLLLFYLIFAAVGYYVYKEKRDDRRNSHIR